jgi:hypothetical protein
VPGEPRQFGVDPLNQQLHSTEIDTLHSEQQVGFSPPDRTQHARFTGAVFNDNVYFPARVVVSVPASRYDLSNVSEWPMIAA